MSATVRHHVFGLDEYFAAERSSETRHEWADGQIFLMAGGSARHDFLETQVLQLIGSRLQGSPCYAMTSNRRLATADDLYTYADGSVFCGEMALGPEQTATNPVVVIEVLSNSTRTYDRGEKLSRYRSIPSLQHVMLIEQDGRDVELWSRDGDAWRRTVHVEDDAEIDLRAVGAKLTVGAIYEGAERFPADG